MKKAILGLGMVFFLAGCQIRQLEPSRTDWYQDKLAGKVKQTRTESTQFTKHSGEPVETPRGVAAVKNYSASGLVSDEAYYHPNGTLLWKASLTYGDKSYKKERRVLAPNGSEREKTVYDYDQNLNMIEEASYRGADELHSRKSYSYDERKQQTELEIYNARGALSDKWIYDYNEEGLKYEEARYYADGTLDTKYGYHFDDKGNPTARLKYNAKGELLEKERYEYEFDAQGNWLKRTTFKSVEGSDKGGYEPIEVSYRTIIYY